MKSRLIIIPGPPSLGVGLEVHSLFPENKLNMIETVAENEETHQEIGAGDQDVGDMTSSGESLREARTVRDGGLNPKHKFRIGAWNVRTLWETSRLAQAIREMERYKLGILGISECRWTGAGKLISQGHTIVYSGHDSDHQGGVALIIDKQISKTLLEWQSVNERIIVARFNSRHTKMTVIQTYAPTNPAEEEVKIKFYDDLQRVINKVPPHDVLIVMGDLNAKVGRDNTGYERNMGKFGRGERNENGEKFLDFCVNNDLAIGGTLFNHLDIHTLTWRSNDRRTINQIDHLAINGKWRSSLLDVRAHRGADMSSDHYMIIAKIRLKLKAPKKEDKMIKRFDTTKLKTPEILQEFKIELRNRYQVLQLLEDGSGEYQEDDDNAINRKWNKIRDLYQETAKEVIGYRKSNQKEWLSQDTWEKIEERRMIREQLLPVHDDERRHDLERLYQSKDREVKRSARKDKRKYISDLAGEAEDAARMGNNAQLYKITKKLCGKNLCKNKPVKDKEGNILTSEEEQAERWSTHFQETLNQPDPEEEALIDDAQEELNINTNPPTRAEVKMALKNLKKNKAPGIDSIQAELMQADLELSTDIFEEFMQQIWETEKIPEDWSRGMIIKIPKKGDLSVCDNWRGITLLSVPSKIIYKIILS